MRRLTILLATLTTCTMVPTAARGDLPFDAPVFQEAWPDTHWISAMTLGNDGAVWAIGGKHDRLLRLQDGAFEDRGPIPLSLPALSGTQLFLQLSNGHFAVEQWNGACVFAEGGALVSEFQGPWYMATLASDGVFFGVRYGEPQVVDVCDLTGQVLDSWELRAGIDVGGIAADSDGRLFVMNWPYAAPRITVHSRTGEILQEWPSTWVPEIRVLPSGNLLLLDDVIYSGGPTRVLSPDGVLLAAWHWWDLSDPWYTSDTPFVMTQDAAGDFLCAFNSPSRISRFSGIGSGLAIIPDADDVPYLVDSVSGTGARSFRWEAGTIHDLSVAPSTVVSSGTYRDFVSWGDLDTPAIQFTVPAEGTGFRLNLRTFHRIEAVVDSAGIATPSLWAPEGEPLTLSATADSGFTFVKWGHPDSTGWQPFDVLDPEWTHVVEGPETWEACFSEAGMTFTISASPDDPWVNTAPPAGGPRQLWLWAVNLDHGLSALEADAAGSLPQFAFVPEGGVLNLAEGPNLFCAIPGCPVGPDVNLRLGSWWVIDNGGDFCLRPSAANDVMAAAHCPSESPEPLPIGVVGFSSIGAPCLAGTMEPPNTDPNDAPEIAGGSPAALALAVRGNPFRAATSLDVTLPAAGPARLRLFDVSGRLVRTLWSGALPVGARTFAWDGRTDGGFAAPAGIYFARLDAPGGRRAAKLVRIAP